MISLDLGIYCVLRFAFYWGVWWGLVGGWVVPSGAGRGRGGEGREGREGGVLKQRGRLR